MIGKAKSNKSLSATLAYNHKQGSEFFFSQNLVSGDRHDLAMQMSDLQKCYTGKGKNLTIHAQLSPAISEGKKLTTKEWQKIASSFLERTGMGRLQCIGYLHRDKEHVHCHLIVNRVDENTFKLYDDSYIMLRSIRAADEVAKELGLTRAMLVKEKINKEKIGSKQEFKLFLENILTQNPKNLEGYFDAIRSGGYGLRVHRDKKTGEARGYGISKGGTYMDASTIDRKLTLRNIEKYFIEWDTVKEKTKTEWQDDNGKKLDQEIKLIRSIKPDKIQIPFEIPDAKSSTSLASSGLETSPHTDIARKKKRRKSLGRISKPSFH
ncbi:MAG: relaxase/mobilization nuclease domain-containing protein [Bacteroidetes bacterium]|nr:relaxase/mobilization nuclease domain-containing protein [Bacteroidota bacterium]